MNDEPALLAAIRAHPAEDTPRLVYADWLDENGQAERAHSLRVLTAPDQFMPAEGSRWVNDIDWNECYNGVGGGSTGNLETLWRDEKNKRRVVTKVGYAYFLAWRERGRLRRLIVDQHHTPESTDLFFDRGLALRVVCSGRVWAKAGDAVLAAHPVDTVELTTSPKWSGIDPLDGSDEDGCRFVDDPARTFLHWVDVTAESTYDERSSIHYLPAALRLRWPGIAFKLPAVGLPP